jgi:hydroxypyruvate isomerase
MPDFAANLATQFADRPLLERFAAAAAKGFDAVELTLPAGPPTDAIAERLRQSRVRLAVIDLAADAGGLAWLPDQAEAFRAAVDRAAAAAVALGCAQVNCRVGAAPAGVPRPILRATLVDNLRRAAARLRAVGRRLLIEPIEGSAADALALIDAVGARNLHLLLDLDRAGWSGERVAALVERHLTRIGHIRSAGDDAVLPVLDRLGYCGWVGRA